MKINLETLTIGEAAYFEKHSGMTLMGFFNSFQTGDVPLAAMPAFLVLIERRAGNLGYTLEQAAELPITAALERVMSSVVTDEAGEPDPES